MEAEEEETVATSSSDFTPVSVSDRRLESGTEETRGTLTVACVQERDRILSMHCYMIGHVKTSNDHKQYRFTIVSGYRGMCLMQV